MNDKTTAGPVAGQRILESAFEHVSRDRQFFGDPSSLINRKRVLVTAVLEASGANKGAPITPQVVVALEQAQAIAGILNAVMPAEALSRAVATGLSAAPMFEIWEDAANQAAAVVRARAEAETKARADAEAKARAAATAQPPIAPPPAPSPAEDTWVPGADEPTIPLRGAPAPAAVEDRVDEDMESAFNAAAAAARQPQG